LLKKKKSYFLENIAFLIVTFFAYYFIIFSNFAELYYIIPTLLCYTILIILRFPKNLEFDYYVIVKDIYQKETKVKIKALDRTKIGKQIDQYLSLKFDQILQEA
jgi:Ca2+/Na+ antiporter